MCTSLVLLTSLAIVTEGVWPGFLGQGHSPIAADTIPLTWSPNENIAWVAELPGGGQSSPIIWKDQVYVTSIDGTMKDRCHVTALSLGDGTVLWNKSVNAAQMVRSNYFQSRSAPTPCADEHGVYVFFETGNLLALTHSGEFLWQRSLTDDYGPFESTIGLASSPLQLGDSLFLLIDHEGPSYLLGVDKKTGDTVWMTERDSRVSYSSPAIVHVRNRPQIVCSSSGSIEGYDPETGERLWKLADDVGGNRAATPLACGDGRFVMAASPGMHNENDAEARKTNGVVTVEQTDSGYVAKVLWRNEKAMSAFNTPTVAEGLAYWVNRVGVLFCFDAESGEEVYSVRLRQGCWSTPVVVGDRLYVFGKDGLTSVVRMGREFELLAENQLWDPHEAGEESEFRRRASGRDAGGGRRTEHAREHAAAPAQVQEVTTVPNSHLDSDPADAGGPAARRGDETRRPEEPARRTPEEEERVRQQGENRFASPVQYGVALVNGSIVIRSGEKVYCLAQQSTQP